MVYPSKISRDAVVNAAVALIQEHGAAALGMRSVAQRLGVRPASLYKHVVDLAGLQSLLAEYAAGELLSAVDAAIARAPRSSSVESLKMPMLFMANEYLKFAREEPALYAMLTAGFSATGSRPSASTLPTERRDALWYRLMHVVGELTGIDADRDAAVAVWAFLHGFITLESTGMFGDAGPGGGFARGVRTIAAGLRRPSSGAHQAVIT